jgi:leader peptidase (prepilin peptidase)/N-methyltransferase
MGVGGLEILIAVWVALMGAVVGSFLNVVVARLPAGQSLVRPRSRCPRCQASIAWYDNVPVLSWLWLRARCRACRAPISFRYPMVELLGAGAALLAWHRHGLSLPALAELGFVDALIALSFIDLDTWLLPHAITRPLIAYGVILGALGMTPAHWWLSALMGAGIGFGTFWLVAFVGEKIFKREALGGGDIWLLSGLGAWLGPSGLLPVVLLASLQGSAVGLALIGVGRAQQGPAAGAGGAGATSGAAEAEGEWVPPRHAVPFGPFLVLGALEWLYLGPRLGEWFPPLGVFL